MQWCGVTTKPKIGGQWAAATMRRIIDILMCFNVYQFLTRGFLGYNSMIKIKNNVHIIWALHLHREISLCSLHSRSFPFVWLSLLNIYEKREIFTFFLLLYESISHVESESVLFTLNKFSNSSRFSGINKDFSLSILRFRIGFICAARQVRMKKFSYWWKIELIDMIS